MNCKKCNSENIVLVEYQGAYDWALEIHCKDCEHKAHRETGFKILSSVQKSDYEDVFYVLHDEEKDVVWYAINRDTKFYSRKMTQEEEIAKIALISEALNKEN